MNTTNRFRNGPTLADAPESQRYLRRLNGETTTPLQAGREIAGKAKRLLGRK